MASARRPIFIVGAMGSGTTLLRLMLDSHEHIAIPHETGFMRAYKAHKFAPFKHSGDNWAGRLGWEQDELRAYMADFYDGLFMRYAERHGKRRWGEKTPFHTWHVDDFLELFPEAQIVAMVRHPLGSAASNISRFGTPKAKASTHWSRYNREIARQTARHREQMVVLRYEDLVLRPEKAARELLDWLGEPWSDAVLQHHEVQSQRGENMRVEGRTRVDDQIDVARIDKWTRTLSPELRDRLGRRLGALGRFYGYSVDDASVLEPIGGPDRILIDGEHVARRVEAFAELDLLRAPEPTPFEQVYDPRKMTLVERDWYERRERRRQRAQREAQGESQGPGRLAAAAARRVRRALERRKP